MFLLPYKSEYKNRYAPVIVPLLIGANALVFGYQIYLGYVAGQQQEMAGLVRDLAVIPHELIRLQGGSADWLPWPLGGPATLVTYQFCHGGILHIGMNMLFLWVFGIAVEDRLGPIRMLLFYLLCGAVGALLHSLLSFRSMNPLIGASGSISGVMAAHMVLFPNRPIRTVFLLFIIPIRFSLPALVVIGYFFLMDVLAARASLQGIDSQIAVWAHIGGFVSGIYLLHNFKGIFFPRYRG